MSQELWPTPMSRLHPELSYGDFVAGQESKTNSPFEPTKWLGSLRHRIGMIIAPLTLDVTHHSFDSAFDIISPDQRGKSGGLFLRKMYESFKRLHRAGL